MKSRVAEIVDIVSLKFASDEAANLSVETSLPEVNWENLHYCHFIRIARIIQVQNQERSMRLMSNMRFLARCAY